MLNTQAPCVSLGSSGVFSFPLVEIRRTRVEKKKMTYNSKLSHTLKTSSLRDYKSAAYYFEQRKTERKWFAFRVSLAGSVLQGSMKSKATLAVPPGHSYATVMQGNKASGA